MCWIGIGLWLRLPSLCLPQLGMAFSVFSLLLWTGLDVLGKTPVAIAETVPAMSPAVVSTLRRVKPLATATAVVVGLTVASGAFVAGNDAGHAYNDWPLMAGRVIPELIWEDKVCATSLVCLPSLACAFRTPGVHVLSGCSTDG
jgi:heme A synthase